MSKFVTPLFHKWQLRPAWKNTGPVFRYMNTMTVRYYPFSPNTTAVKEFWKRVNTTQQHLHTEKNFKLNLEFAPFGAPATVVAEYRNGDKLELSAENHNAEELLAKLMYKRHDLEDQLEWAECHTLLTLEEEAMMVGGSKRDEQGGKGGKGGKKAPAKGGAKPAAAKGKKK